MPRVLTWQSCSVSRAASVSSRAAVSSAAKRLSSRQENPAHMLDVSFLYQNGALYGHWVSSVDFGTRKPCRSTGQAHARFPLERWYTWPIACNVWVLPTHLTWKWQNMASFSLDEIGMHSHPDEECAGGRGVVRHYVRLWSQLEGARKTKFRWYPPAWLAGHLWLARDHTDRLTRSPCHPVVQKFKTIKWPRW